MNADVDGFKNALNFDDSDGTALMIGDQTNAKSFALDIDIESISLTFDAEVCKLYRMQIWGRTQIQLMFLILDHCCGRNGFIMPFLTYLILFILRTAVVQIVIQSNWE